MAIWNNESVGTRIKRLREKKGLTQEKLALATGLSEPAIARLETGMAKAVAEYRDRLAEALGTTADYLLNGESYDVQQSMKIVANNRLAWNLTEEEEKELRLLIENLAKARSNVKVPLKQREIENLLEIIRSAKIV